MNKNQEIKQPIYFEQTANNYGSRPVLNFKPSIKYKNPNSVNLLYDLNTDKNDLTSMSEVNALVGRKTSFNINLRYFTIKPGHQTQPI